MSDCNRSSESILSMFSGLKNSGVMTSEQIAQWKCGQCDKLAVDHPSESQEAKGNLVVTLLTNNGTTFSRHVLVEKPIPTSINSFWSLVGDLGDAVSQDLLNRDGRVSVLSVSEDWVKMQNANFALGDLQKIDGCYQFQVRCHNTPYNSPTQLDAAEMRSDSVFVDGIRRLFSENPFNGNVIPTLHEDDTIKSIKTWLNVKSLVHTDAMAVATLFAMPGSGKTRSVKEAAKLAGITHRHNRIRICDVPYAEVKLCRDYVNKCVQKFVENNNNNNSGISIHFDEVQSLLLEKDGEETLKQLAAACTALANEDTRLKFVFTGTNINARTPIDLGSKLKTQPFFMDGSFPKDFVRKLYEKHIEKEVDEEMETLFERCRHNRRVTAHFLRTMWNEKDTVSRPASAHYEDAVQHVCSTITSELGGDAHPAACRIFRILLQSISAAPDLSLSTAGEGQLTSKLIPIAADTSASDLAYIRGGGLNVSSCDATGAVHVFLPEGCVYEILARVMGRAVQRATYNILLSFLRTSAVKTFNFGWFMEALVVHDLTCAASEFEKLLGCGERDATIMEATIVTEAKLWECIPAADPTQVIWWVRDEMNSHQNRWIDVAYRQADGKIVIIECKSGVTDTTGAAQSFFQKAIKLAERHSDIQWIAVYLSSSALKNYEVAETAINNVQMKVLVLPENSSFAKTLDAARGNNLEEQENVIADHLSPGGVQTDGHGVYAGDSQGLTTPPTRNGKRLRGNSFDSTF